MSVVLNSESLFNRRKSVHLRHRKQSSFLLSVRTFFSASIAEVAATGAKDPEIYRFLSTVFKSFREPVMSPARARHSALIKNISSVASPLNINELPVGPS